jgi:hypothetical protein
MFHLPRQNTAPGTYVISMNRDGTTTLSRIKHSAGAEYTSILIKNVVTSYLTMNRTLLTTVMGVALLIATGIVPMIFEANQTHSTQSSS